MIHAVAITLAAVVTIGLLLFVRVHLYAYGWIWLDGVRMRRSLARQGRTLELSEVREKIGQKDGMIIVDAPTLGWNVSRVWWSPTQDFVPRPASREAGRLCSREDFLNYKRFIDPSSGVAKLIAGFVITQRLDKFLKRNFGTSACGFVFSGGVLTEEKIKARHDGPGASPKGGRAAPLGNSGLSEGPPSVT